MARDLQPYVITCICRLIVAVLGEGVDGAIGKYPVLSDMSEIA